MSAPGEEIGLQGYMILHLNQLEHKPNINECIYHYTIFNIFKITLNTNHTLSINFIKGKYSGASGFLRSAVSDSPLQVETNGEFIPNEPLIFNGIENSRVSIAVTNFGVRDKINI